MLYMDGGIASKQLMNAAYVEYLCASSVGMFINMTCEVSTHKSFHNVVVSNNEQMVPTSRYISPPKNDT